MAYQITQTITDPGTAPARTDPDNFDARADAFLSVLSTWGAAGTGDLNVLKTQMNALSTAVNGYSTAAETAETNAETAETNAETAETNAEAAQSAAEAAQSAAEAASNATEWLVGTTYDDGDVVWGSDSLSYRAAQGSNTGHDPVGDGGTWWIGLKGAETGANSDITSMTGLSDNGIPHAKIANLQGNKNAIINGDFNIWQRGTSFAAIANAAYSADRCKYEKGGDMVHTISQDTDVPTQSESGHKSNYSLKVDCTTIDASIDAGDYVFVSQNIEGYNFAPFVGKTATLSFWVKAVKAGIYCVAFQSYNADRSYVVEYTINAASTWEKKTVTLTFDYSGGTWDYTNGVGVKVKWVLACGSTYQGVADTWNSAIDLATSNQVNGVDSTDNNFWLAQVQFELGSVATDFEYRQIGDELARCQRYCFVPALTAYSFVGWGVAISTTTLIFFTRLPVTMRDVPSLTVTASEWTVGDQVAGGIALTALTRTAGQTNQNIIRFEGTVASGLTQYRNYYLAADGTAGRIMILSSEL